VNSRVKFIAGGAAITLALGYMIYAGVTQSAVYFITPSELQAAPVTGKAYRLGGMVAAGSVQWDAPAVELSFRLTDSKASIPVRHRGTPPDLFGEGRGAVVEGSWAPEGYFEATLIMAKHSEDYQAPHGEARPDGYQDLIKTLQRSSPAR
jgi:cytochrome c-type biogenesis protein CcmE